MASTLENTKYQRITDILREKIRSRELQPEERLPSFSEMRSQYGATTTTTERVYSILEQEGLVKREKGRGIFVAQLEQAPATGVIGVSGLSETSSTIAHPWGMHLLSGIRKVAREAQKEVLLYPQLHTGEVKWERVDGILNIEADPPIILPYLPIGMPFVSALIKMEGHASVVADETGGVRLAMEHLLQLGHRRIAYLIMHTTPNVAHLQPRVTAYRNALHSAGIEIDPRWLRHLDPNDSLFYQEYGYLNMKQWLEEDWHELGCTALLAQNDDAAIGAMQALQKAGYRVPEDVSVVGFDGTEIGRYCMPHLTSVALPLEEIGALAMKQLLLQIREEPQPFSTLELPTRLLLRNSTAPAKTV